MWEINGLMFCKYRKIQTFRRHIDRKCIMMFFLSIQNLIVMEEVFHFHQQTEPLQLQ
jgi:hypothetical protein